MVVMSIRKSFVAIGAAIAFVLAGCGTAGENAGEAEGDALSVKASFYPLQYLVEEIGAEKVSVESLTPPGTDAHSLELSPKVVSELSTSDAVVYLHGFQSAVDAAVAETGPSHVLDVTDAAKLAETGASHDHDHGEDAHDHDEDSEDGHDHADHDEHADDAHDHADHDEAEHDAHADDPHDGADHDEHADDTHDEADHDKHEEHAEDDHEGHDHGEEGHHHDLDSDPHFWLDADRMASVATEIGNFLGEVDADNAAFYRENAQKVSKEMQDLADEMKSGLATCKQHTFIVSHEAFGYLAQQTGLKQVGVSGLDPEVTPSPERLSQISALVKETDSKVIYAEANISPKVIEVLADDLGIETMILDPGATQNDPDMNYVDIMKQNLENLRKGLNCK